MHFPARGLSAFLPRIQGSNPPMNTHNLIPALTRGRSLDRLLLLTTLALALPLGARGQTPAATGTAAEEPVQMSPFEVSQEANSGYLAKNTLSVGRVNTNVMDIPQTVNIVNAQLLSDMQVSGDYLPAALMVSGGITRRSFNSGQDQFIWGFRTLGLLMNGFTFRGNTQGELYDIDHIEILKGPNAQTFGSSAQLVGGVLNFVMRQPTDTPQAKVIAEYGQYSERRFEVHTSGPVTTDKKLKYRFDFGTHDSHENKRNFDFISDRFVGGQVDWDVSPTTVMKVVAGYLRSSYNHARTSMDPNSSSSPLVSQTPLKSDTWTFGEPGDKLQSRWFRTDVTFLSNLGTDLSSRTFIGYNQFNNNWNETNPQSYGPRNAAGLITTLNRQFLSYIVSDHAVTAQQDFTYSLVTGPFVNKIQVGGEELGTTTDNYQLSYNQSPIDIYNPVYGSAPGALFSALYPYNSTRQSAGYAQDEMHMFSDRVILNFGFRSNDSIQVSESAPVQTGTSVPVNRVSQNTIKYGVAVHPIPHTMIYASHLEAFIFNTGTNYLGLPLIPSLATDNEIGAKAELLDGGLILTVCHFDLKQTNVRTLGFGFNPVVGAVGQIIVQSGFNANQGYDFSAVASKKVGTVELDGTATMYHGNILNNYGQKPITPANNTWSLLGAARALKGSGLAGLSGGIGYYWQGTRLAPVSTITLNNNHYPAYGECDAFADYQLGRWKVGLNLNNIGNKKYVIGDEGDFWIWINPGLTWKVSASLSF